MSDSQSKRTLTEISHLFLSSVRDRQTGGTARPMRRPPVTTESIDLTPEEFAEVFTPDDGGDREVIAPLTAAIATHFGADQPDRVRRLARHLAAGNQRIGLIELDADHVRVSCFEPSLDAAPAHEPSQDRPFDAQEMINAIEEMNVDVDRWILSILNPRLPAARALLRQVRHWTLLSGGDHDGVVAAYRTLKGLADANRPELALAVINAADEQTADRVFHKLAGVCGQFLSWSVAEHTSVGAADGVIEHIILDGRIRPESPGTSPWQVLSGFASRAARGPHGLDEHLPRAGERIRPASDPAPRRETFLNGLAPSLDANPSPAPGMMQLQATEGDLPGDADAPEVLELPAGAASADGVLAAVLAHRTRGLVECSVRPPAFAGARLAVDRDRRLILFAVASEGLSDLGDIARAYQWLIENRGLVAMALPQLNIDAPALPSLRLLVDHHDLRADLLQPLLANQTVTVESYRRLRWGDRVGILLEAA